MARNQSISDADRDVVARSIKQAKLVEASRKMARIVKHTDPPPKAKAARTRLEKDLTKWMKHHGGDAFDQPFCADHHKVISRIDEAINKGGLFALAMPRGAGKSTILKWATLYCMLTGRRKFVVVVAATAEMAQAIIEFVRQQMQESDSLHEHYPHVTTYARATDGKAIKAKFQLRADGKASGIQWSKSTLVLPEVMNSKGNSYPSNGAILEGHGLTGAIRGKWKDTKTGKVLRPDFALCDDPQTRESAESESQCNMRERIITGDVLGLAGPRKRIAAVMPCTVVKGDDLAARFLDHERHPEWQGILCRMVDKWPAAQETLWKEYAAIYKEAAANGEGTNPALEYYKTNRAAMDAGAVLSWDARIRDGELSALQTAENLLIEMGDQFWAEYQNEPKKQGTTVYNITPQAIMAKTTDRAAGVVPETVRTIVCGIDVNYAVGLTWGVAGFAQQTAHVLDYGRHDMALSKDMPEQELARLIYEAIVTLGRGLTAKPYQLNLAVFDIRGWNYESAYNLSAQGSRATGIPLIGGMGFGARQYRPGYKSVGRRGSWWHDTIDTKRRKYIAYCSDFWRETAQKAWLGSIGAPGSIDLPRGNHREFADQICREPLLSKMETPLGLRWEFASLPGHHDFGDVMHMIYMGADYLGMGTGGAVGQVNKPAQQRTTQRKVRHVAI